MDVDIIINELFNCDTGADLFHDVVMDALDTSYELEKLKAIFHMLPSYIQTDAIAWGLNDTVFREEAHVYIKQDSARFLGVMGKD